MNVPPAGFNFMGTGPPLPRNKYDRKYIASLQRTNLEMACWRRDPGGWQQGAANQPQNPAQMPIPWKNRNQEAPSVWLPVANPFTVWKLPFRGMTFRKPIRAGLDHVTDPTKLTERTKRAYDRLQDAKGYFETGAATPNTGQRWKYQRCLGYGGNGIVTHFRIFETNPERHRDVAVKVQLKGWDAPDLREERELTKKLSHSAHIIQEDKRDPVGNKPARDRIPLAWDPEDSSEWTDSSGDEDTPATRPATRKQRKDRASLTADELSRKITRWDSNPDPPARAPKPSGPLPDHVKDFIVLEFAQNGDLRNLIAKVNEMGNRLPTRVLWSFWLCLIKQCIGMAYYPRKFNPGRRQANGADLDEVIPPDAQKWRAKNLVHFDFDPLNVFISGLEPGNNEHRLIPKLKLADFGLATVVKDQKRNSYYLRQRPYAKFNFYSPEQFGAEWDFIPGQRNGTDLLNDPVAGNFGTHTNIWAAALVMWCLMTGSYPLQPAVAGNTTVTDGIRGPRAIVTYGNVLYNGMWDHIDPQLRGIVNWCMAHNPADRPSLEHLLAHAQTFWPRVPPPGEDDLRIHTWLQDQVLSAPTLRQEIADPLNGGVINKSI